MFQMLMGSFTWPPQYVAPSLPSSARPNRNTRSGSQILTICLRRKTLPFPSIIIIPIVPVILPCKSAPTTTLSSPTIAPALPISVEGLTKLSSTPLLPPTCLNFPGALVILPKHCQLYPCLPALCLLFQKTSLPNSGVYNSGVYNSGVYNSGVYHY